MEPEFADSRYLWICWEEIEWKLTGWQKRSSIETDQHWWNGKSKKEVTIMPRHNLSQQNTLDTKYCLVEEREIPDLHIIKIKISSDSTICHIISQMKRVMVTLAEESLEFRFEKNAYQNEIEIRDYFWQIARKHARTNCRILQNRTRTRRIR